ncbi:hypothetical protein MMC18_002300 [Xylographa bjoerkii]|nr:hypothetical protein [Xylographa bjoerkii]
MSYDMTGPQICFRSPIEPAIRCDEKTDKAVVVKLKVERRSFPVPDIAIFLDDLHDRKASISRCQDADALRALNIPTLEIVSGGNFMSSPMHTGQLVVAALPVLLGMQAGVLNRYLSRIVHPYAMEAKDRKYQGQNQQETYVSSWWEGGQSSPVVDKLGVRVEKIYVVDEEGKFLGEEFVSPLHSPSLFLPPPPPECCDIPEEVDVNDGELTYGIPPPPPPPECYEYTSEDLEKSLIHDSSMIPSRTDTRCRESRSFRRGGKVFAVLAVSLYLALPFWVLITPLLQNFSSDAWYICKLPYSKRE